MNQAPLQTILQRVEAANAKKEAGNVFYKDGSFDKAEKTYQKVWNFQS